MSIFRLTGISESTTSMFMSISKVILVIRPDIYLGLNRSKYTNLATVLLLMVLLIDIVLRIYIHCINGCIDPHIYNLYNSEFSRGNCQMWNTSKSSDFYSVTPNTDSFQDNNDMKYSNKNSNVTLFDNAVENFKSGACIDIPVMSIAVLGVIIFEFLKIILIFKQFFQANLRIMQSKIISIAEINASKSDHKESNPENQGDGNNLELDDKGFVCFELKPNHSNQKSTSNAGKNNS